MAFHYRYRLSGGQPTVQDLVFKDDETLTKGDLVNLEAGEIDLAVSGDIALLGVVLETITGVDSTTKAKVITDADAVYGCTDANARKIGATLDITGSTGAQTLAASSDKDVIVVADSTAAQETLVKIQPARHALGGTATY